MNDTLLRTDSLSMFVAPSYEIRWYLLAPWRADGWLWATDGKWLVRLPDDGRECAEVTGRHPKTDALIAGAEEATYSPLPTLPAPVVCLACKGTGRVNNCPDCDGGEFDYGLHTYKCQECEGTGSVDGDTEVCSSCDGTGESWREGMDIGGSRYAVHYVRRLASLPGIEFSAQGDTKAGYFRFDGGYGLLMPMRKE